MELDFVGRSEIDALFVGRSGVNVFERPSDRRFEIVSITVADMAARWL
jgi:hypothetical protein